MMSRPTAPRVAECHGLLSNPNPTQMEEAEVIGLYSSGITKLGSRVCLSEMLQESAHISCLRVSHSGIVFSRGNRN